MIAVYSFPLERLVVLTLQQLLHSILPRYASLPRYLLAAAAAACNMSLLLSLNCCRIIFTKTPHYKQAQGAVLLLLLLYT